MSMLFAKEPQKVRRIKTKYRQIVTDLPAPESNTPKSISPSV